MSICSNTLRAYSHSRIPPSKTLFPFLYQTSTIQQWQPATRPIARRSITTRPRRNSGDTRSFKQSREDIPFEDDTLPPAIDQEPPRKTTITGSERAAFQKLYRKFNTEGRQKKDKDHVVELDQIADEYYEDEEENSKPSLDKVFDEVLKGEPRFRTSRTRPQRQKTTGDELGQDAILSFQRLAKLEELNKTQRGEKVDAAKLKEMRLAERERVDKLIRNAATDRALWQVLEREVFEKVRELDLDNTSGTEQASQPNNAPRKLPKPTKPKYKPDPPSVDARILFQNYPHHLITALHTLRTEFSSSTLPFAILPTIKSLGRSSHALGATTLLYRHLIRTAWIQQASYSSIDTLLTEMDNNAIEFDADILALLEAIIKEHNMARTGDLGREMQMVYGMEMWLEGIKKIREWRSMVAERLGIVSQEKRDSGMIVRRMVHEKDNLWRKVDPKHAAQRGQGVQEVIPLVEGVNMAEDGAGAVKEQTDDQDAYTSSDEQLIRDHDHCEEIIRPAQILL